jgi:hypothetical protein
MSKYTRDLKIDRYNIDEELLRQPQLYIDWALKAANAEVETKEAEHDYDIVRGEVEKKVRLNPKLYGLDKITESALKYEASINSKVRKYFKIWMNALRNEKVLKRAEKAFQQRKDMLESLTFRDSRIYHAEPRVPISKRETMDLATRRDIQKQLKKRKRKKR